MKALTVRRTTTSSAQEVWDVIADGFTYASWVVGASRIRAVEAAWPNVGAKIHHSVGTWPTLLDDETEVLEVETGRRIVLHAKAWPVGRAKVEIVLTPTDEGTQLEMREDADSGPAKAMPKPGRQAAIFPRNRETLLRLALLAERPTQP